MTKQKEDSSSSGWGGYGSFIPQEILVDPDLKATEKLLFGLIYNLSKGLKGCYASNKTLSDLMNLRPQTISNMISALRNHRCIKVKMVPLQNNRLERRIYINEDYHEIFKTKLKRWILEGSKNLRHFEIAGGYDGLMDIIGGYDGHHRYKEEDINELPKGNSGMIFNHPSISDEEDNEDSTGRILSRRKSQDMIITEKELILIKEEETKDDYNNIKSAEIKEILRHWNNQLETRSVRLPKNGNAPTKIYTKVVKTYLPRLLQNGYGASIIKKSISIYNELLHNTYDYILRDDVIGHKVSFDEFLNGFTVNTKKRIFPNNPVKKGTVWFKECLKGQDYLDDKYGLEVKDKYPKWTQEVKDFIMKPTTNTKAGTYPYVDYRFPEINFKGSEHMQNGNFSISERNFCVRVAKRLNIFIDTYAEYDNGKKKSIKWMRGDDRMLWVLFLFRAISHTIGDGQKIPLTYLTSTKTYEQLLPNFLKYDNKLDKNFIPLDMPWKDYKDKHNRKGGK